MTDEISKDMKLLLEAAQQHPENFAPNLEKEAVDWFSIAALNALRAASIEKRERAVQ